MNKSVTARRNLYDLLVLDQDLSPLAGCVCLQPLGNLKGAILRRAVLERLIHLRTVLCSRSKLDGDLSRDVNNAGNALHDNFFPTWNEWLKNSHQPPHERSWRCCKDSKSPQQPAITGEEPVAHTPEKPTPASPPRSEQAGLGSAEHPITIGSDDEHDAASDDPATFPAAEKGYDRRSQFHPSDPRLKEGSRSLKRAFPDHSSQQHKARGKPEPDSGRPFDKRYDGRRENEQVAADPQQHNPFSAANESSDSNNSHDVIQRPGLNIDVDRTIGMTLESRTKNVFHQFTAQDVRAFSFLGGSKSAQIVLDSLWDTVLEHGGNLGERFYLSGSETLQRVAEPSKQRKP